MSAWESSCYAATRVREHYVFRYRIRNWREYNRALVNRGRLTVWFDEEAIAARRKTEPGPGPGAPRRYSDLALECALVLKAVFHLSLRATQGFLASVRELMALTLPIPDYSMVSRRQGALQLRLPAFLQRRAARLYPTAPIAAPPSWRVARNHVLQQIDVLGHYGWRVASGCTRQSVAENTIFRLKTLFGGRLWARCFENQRTEARVKCSVLNRMTQLGMPETVRVM